MGMLVESINRDEAIKRRIKANGIIGRRNDRHEVCFCLSIGGKNIRNFRRGQNDELRWKRNHRAFMIIYLFDNFYKLEMSAKTFINKRRKELNELR